MTARPPFSATVAASAAAAALLLSPASAQDAASTEAACPARSAAAAYTESEVREQGLVGVFFDPAAQGVHPAILVLGGSEGGIDTAQGVARAFADSGYAVLALAYFGMDGLPPQMASMPLEYFSTAVDWLAAQEDVDPERLGLYGVSKGAEAALVIGSREPRLKAIAAGMPTHVSWQGLDRSDYAAVPPSWTEGGEPIPFVAYDYSRGFRSIFELYSGALAGEIDPDAVIRVERINGPVMLISGDDDTMWPAQQMAELVVERLRGNDFPHAVTHLAYRDAGHAVGMPPSFGSSPMGPDSMVGGTDEGNAFARADMWGKLQCFFDDALAFEVPE